MAERRLFAGPAVRRLRRDAAMTQAAMAEALDISPSYLNLIENGQRPLTATVMVKLAERFDFDVASLGGEEVPGGQAGLRRRLADPRFADLGIGAQEVEEWLQAAPTTAAAFARLFDAAPEQTSETQAEPAEVAAVRRAIEQWRNHFADLDARAEELADELRLAGGDLYGTIAERLRTRHQLGIRVLPSDVMPDRLRWLDWHARQLMLNELLRPASRTFQAAATLGQMEAKDQIDALVAGAEFAETAAAKLFERHLIQYFAAALMMPYGRFLRACDATGYDLLLLQRRFGAGFEQVAHRLTTLQRVGARGLPFFMLRIDRAGQVSKRYAGASQSPLVDGDGRCPLWAIHEAFSRPGEVVADLVELEDGTRWFTQSRTVAAPGSTGTNAPARFAVCVGVDAKVAAPLVAARGIDLMRQPATPIGLGCRRCTRSGCVQRSMPPIGRALRFREGERGVSAFDFAGD
ncbi:short-chain fatty acyl-CoA regulator family protein [Sphingopyxis sp. XHP0097]|uniref:Short-chain fatty acyl-CoA regulator family protein n=1 Tax=Sphingopyxis jiangsuensis TaxID=2871171 RepID=A0ABS7MDR0_9SPHN|nr:helix-turn-helix transcriptional regulator [Sphingopyxis jiangsuensis]MBY4636978.1 short-chain fatty acyl-CoA regulator family protein [Sphingopyxis jiangsuensis]